MAEALRSVEQTGKSQFQAELYRIKGELLRMQDPGEEAEPERCLRTAIDIARRQSARLFESRVDDWTKLKRRMSSLSARHPQPPEQHRRGGWTLDEWPRDCP